MARRPVAERPPDPTPVRSKARLRRMGIRWGMVSGARVTGQFPALPAMGVPEAKAR